MINRTIPGLTVSLVSFYFFGFIQLFSLPAVKLRLTVFYGALTKNLSCTVRFLPAHGIKTLHSSGLFLRSFVTKCDRGCTVCMACATSTAYGHTSNSTVRLSTAEYVFPSWPLDKTQVGLVYWRFVSFFILVIRTIKTRTAGDTETQQKADAGEIWSLNGLIKVPHRE